METEKKKDTKQNYKAKQGRYLRNGTVRKRIPMMRETIPHETQFALFNILFNRIIIFILRNFLFCICPAGDFNNHIENLWTCGGRGSQEWNIMPWRDNDAVFFKVDAMVEGIRRTYRRETRGLVNVVH